MSGEKSSRVINILKHKVDPFVFADRIRFRFSFFFFHFISRVCSAPAVQRHFPRRTADAYFLRVSTIIIVLETLRQTDRPTYGRTLIRNYILRVGQ